MDQLVRVTFINSGLQVLSTAVDGCLKVWNLKKNTCVGTIQAHQEKLWALDTRSDQIVTGAADSNLKVWADCTEEFERNEQDAEAERTKNEMALSNFLYDNDFVKAAELAFKLDRQRDLHFALQELLLRDRHKQLNEIDSVVQDRVQF